MLPGNTNNKLDIILDRKFQKAGLANKGVFRRLRRVVKEKIVRRRLAINGGHKVGFKYVRDSDFDILKMIGDQVTTGFGEIRIAREEVFAVDVVDLVKGLEGDEDEEVDEVDDEDEEGEVSEIVHRKVNLEAKGGIVVFGAVMALVVVFWA